MHGKKVRVGRGSRNQFELTGKEVAERPDVCKIVKKSFLYGWTWCAYNIERVVASCVCFVIFEDEYDLFAVEEYIPRHCYCISEADQP